MLGFLGDRRGNLGLTGHVLAVMLGHLIIFVFGLTWLARFVGIERVFELGLLPFIPGMIVKSIAAGLLMTGLWRLNSRPS